MGYYDWDAMDSEEVTQLYKRKIARGGQITVARVEVGRGSVTKAHTHENEEVILVLEGAWLFRLPRREVTLRANQMLTIPPWVEHSSEALEDTVALDICSTVRSDWITGEDRFLHEDPDDFLWAV